MCVLPYLAGQGAVNLEMFCRSRGSLVMGSLESVCYPVDPRTVEALGPLPAGDGIRVRTFCRSLDGMLKESIVLSSATGQAWCMLSDEGPYLNGTDLAPCPLAFMTTGMVSGFMDALRAEAMRKGLALAAPRLVQHSTYGMEGSALRGTMTGSADPVRLQIHGLGGGEPAALMAKAKRAVAAAPVSGLLHDVLISEFSLTLNGAHVAPARVKATTQGVPEVGYESMDSVPRKVGGDAGLITRLEAVEAMQGVEGGAGSSLRAEQKRKLRLRGDCSLRADGAMQVVQEMFNPLGSKFRLTADAPAALGGRDRAPDAHSFVAAGIAFCFMTQLGRYAQIVKAELPRHWIVQDIHLSHGPETSGTPAAATASPVVTHLFVDSPEDENFARQLLDMGEQTCFLHALCRTQLGVEVELSPA